MALVSSRSIEKDINRLKKIRGISFKYKGKIFRNPKREFCKNLDKLKIDTYDLVDVSKYKLPFSNRPAGLVAPQRGCPFDCIFCTSCIYYGKKPRYKSIEAAMDEIHHLVYENKVRDIGFWSEVLTLNEKYTKKLFETIIKEKIDANFYLTTRVDNLNKEVLKIMKKAGVVTIAFGIESACQRILDLAKKGITVSQTKRAIKNIKALNMNALGHVIFGLPGEDRKSMKTTLNFVIKNRVDFANFYIAVPYPGTEFFKMAETNGWLTTYDWSKYALQNAVISYPHLSDKMLKEFRKFAFFKFYSRPRKMLSVFKSIGLANLPSFLSKIGRVYSNWVSG